MEARSEQQALEILYSIAQKLNRAVDLNAALQISLVEAVHLLQMQTGWIWLLHPSTNSVFLGASHNLPPAFIQHPERLSGWCYCIEKYLNNQLETAANISEITCTRLKDLEEGTNGLRFHATVPLYDGEKKIGLLNLVSESSGQLTETQLSLLHKIGELLSITIQRTRLYEKSKEIGVLEERKRLMKQFQNSLQNPLDLLNDKISDLQNSALIPEKLKEIQQVIEQINELSHLKLKEEAFKTSPQKINASFQYPISPLTKRELEVIELLKQGKTNKTIGVELFISERTVKFHVSIILNKLEAKNRTEAVQIALKHGIINL